MPLTTITFFPANRDAALSDIELKAALETVKGIAPPGSRCEVRALDDTFMEIKVPPGGPPDYAFEDSGVLPKPFAPAAATIWFDDELEDIEYVVQQTMKRAHEALDAKGSGVFDARRHLDLVKDGPLPKLQILCTMEKRPDIDRDAFIQYYRATHVKAAKTKKPAFTRYTTCRQLEGVGDMPFDCITVLEYASLDVLRDSLTQRLEPAANPTPSDLPVFAKRIVYNLGERNFV